MSRRIAIMLIGCMLSAAHGQGAGPAEDSAPSAAIEPADALAYAETRRLAEEGDTRSQTTLGLMHAQGIGVPRDMTEARRWWGRAAEKNDPGAQYNLGTVYLQGQSVATDAARAHYWFKRAAERGHLLAQTNLGLLYLDGRGTRRDEVLGAMWLTVAAQRGEDGARSNLKRFRDRLNPATLDEANKRAAWWLKKFAQPH